MRAWAMISVLLMGSLAIAKDVRRPAPVKKADPKRSSKGDASGTADSVLERLRALYSGLEYDQVIPLAEALLARDDLTIDQRLEGYRLQGSAKAIVEDPSDAEKPFRLLLRARTDYDLPADTPPKILAVFRKVQSEEKALAAQLKDVERSRVIANLRLVGEPPKEAKGGRPLKLSFRLRDPTSAVETVKVPYRRGGQKVFSTLALERSEDGDWRGQIPGEFTADEHGFTLEYYVETADRDGPLLSVGSEKKPNELPVLAGLVPTTRPKPVPPWVFWTGVGVTGALGATAGGLGYGFNRSQADYRTAASAGGDVDGARLAAQARTGQTLATATNVALVSAAVALVATAVLTPLTRFSDD